MSERKKVFEVLSYTILLQVKHGKEFVCEADMKVKTGKHTKHEVASGDGVIEALYYALCKTLDYKLSHLKILEYKICVTVDSCAKVSITFFDGKHTWIVVKESIESMDAVIEALVEGLHNAIAYVIGP